MVVQKKVTLDTPIRTLLPAGFVAKPDGAEITLVDLATQHSGLPRMPDNFKPQNPVNPYADYHAAQLQEFIARHGVAKPADAAFLYSNLGFGLLGYGLSLRAGVPYGQLVATEVTGPLHMSDTGVTLSPEQRTRLIQGYDSELRSDAAVGSGRVRRRRCYQIDGGGHAHLSRWEPASRQVRERRGRRFTGGNSAGRSRPGSSSAREHHRERTRKIALAWFFNPKADPTSIPAAPADTGHRSLLILLRIERSWCSTIVTTRSRSATVG